MVTKREFNRIKRENPESRIGQRTREEQKVRNELAKTLIKARKSGVETPYEEYTGRLTKEKQKIEGEKNKILQEIDDLVQKKERDSQQIGKELDSLKQQKEQEKNRLLQQIEEIKQKYEESIGELNEIEHKKPYEIIEHLEQHLDSLSYPEMLKALDLLKSLLENVIKKNRPDNFEELKGNPDKVIADLKKNHMKVDENVEMCGYKGKIVHIELPSVGGFEGYRFDYFISDEVVEVDTYNNIKGTIKYHTKRSFGKFLNNLNRYMQQFGIELDKGEVHNWGFEGKINENYEYGMDYRYTGDSSCMIGDYVLGLLNFGRGLLTGYTLLGADALFTVGAGLSNSDEFCFDSIKRVKRGHIMAIVNDEESILEPSETTDSLIEKEVRKAQEAFLL